MQASPLVSIITVCWNSAQTIRRAFDSVLQQEYPHIDYVVVDGASSDDTVEIIKSYETKFLSKGVRFRWVSEPDEGIYDAMNKGIALCRGDIIGTLNSDDFYEPNAVQCIADAYAAHPEAGIFYGFLRVLRDGKEFWTYRYKYESYLLNLKSGIYSAAQHPTCFVRHEVYDQIGVFDTQFPVAADYDFLIRAMQGGIKFFPLDVVLSNFSSGGVSDQMSDFERHKQRYEIWYKNGLISEDEYQKKRGQLRYQRYKELKRRLAGWLMRN